ncbi:glycosyltransferase family 2 protein [Pedobacter lithocola]|uniref:Glycosyltransferase family 2 protein n=1 Tax=Pedobacter lithocola TaxID=1908239 RepID=A0ABV8PBN3_9SPHI
MNKPEIINSPSKWERFRLRVMIFAGTLVMLLFLNEVLKGKSEFPVLYYMLLVTIIYTCLRLLHEWIHYFYIIVPVSKHTEKIYTVDIFTTFCKGEPYEMIEETLLAIVNISYPHKSYLCDESDDQYLKELCHQMGIIHVTRTDKKNAKAGNINNALLISSGELCVILDPDHVPQPNFLDPIVAHFNDENIGFVQIVQAYKNFGESLVAKGAAQQTFQFYGPIMMTMNKYGTVLAIGANCTFRRRALDSIGGHAAGLAEDMNTAMHLHAKGWKSIYVPQILARGLVPSTMSAYYSQQLKWSRGVFELLVTSYPKLFNKFTWQQKIHYALIPLYYLSGIIFLINFLIPILSLAFDTSPINIDFLYFMLYAGPLVLLSFLIRLFVQRWVMEEEERGFHIVGGLLMIGTWWIFLIGLYYAILRKKVPYNPTPKDGYEENNWKINIPNIAIIIASILSIIYSLHTDWNPYNLIMSGFATLNCIILSFSIFAARQAYFRSLKRRNYILEASLTKVSIFKKKFWLLRRFLYKQVRNSALLLTVMITGFMVFWSIKARYVIEKPLLSNYNKNILVPGIFAPSSSNGLSSVKNVIDIQKSNNVHFGIVSLYLSWGDSDKSKFPTKLLDSIYQNSAIPMISWEPWQSLFAQSKEFKPENIETHVFQRIIEHRYDKYLEDFANRLKKINKPIFLRFAHEADNPQYPWSSRGINSAEEFKQAWKYIHNFFSERKLNNVIWVWNPWKPVAISKYFPGKEFVDWIGVTNLNYNIKNSDYFSMEQLYQPFHKHPVFNIGLPVMLAEMGSLKTNQKQGEWFKQAAKTLESKFPEIKAFILFNSGVDFNLPDGYSGQTLDWQIEDYSNLKGLFHSSRKNDNWLQSLDNFTLSAQLLNNLTKKKLDFLDKLRGVNYNKGQNWSTNGLVLKKKIITKDMNEIKKMGFNTIKIYGFSVYDKNILEVADEKNLKVAFSFWLPENVSFITDSLSMNKYSKKILAMIKKLKDRKNIIFWNIANNPMNSLRYKNYKPDLLTEQKAYFLWLNKLIRSVREIDNIRPISMDIYIDENFAEDYNLLLSAVPGIDCIGLVENSNLNIQANGPAQPAFMSSISTKSYLTSKRITKGVFLSNWQDEKTTNYVSLNGIKDNTGKVKLESYDLSYKWNALKLQVKMPLIKILLPAVTIWPNTSATYHALIYEDKQWHLTDKLKRFNFRWELIKYDQYENPIEVIDIGTGNPINVSIPKNPSRYKIRLYTNQDSIVSVVQSKLNMPLKSIN